VHFFFVLATGVRRVSFGHFGYRGETCELCSILATGVRLVSFVRFWLQGKTCELVALGYSWVTEV
jgi:hypothetical protein